MIVLKVLYWLFFIVGVIIVVEEDKEDEEFIFFGEEIKYFFKWVMEFLLLMIIGGEREFFIDNKDFFLNFLVIEVWEVGNDIVDFGKIDFLFEIWVFMGIICVVWNIVWDIFFYLWGFLEWNLIWIEVVVKMEGSGLEIYSNVFWIEGLWILGVFFF